MKRIILSGADGKMGKVVAQVVKNRANCEIIAGIDQKEGLKGDFSIYDSLDKIKEGADVLIDFSHPNLLSQILNYGISHKLPLVICTTGMADNQIEKINQFAQKIPIFYSGNTSLGINLMIELSQKAAAVFGGAFDIEIIEKHHNQKIDSPSGTALMLANSLTQAMNNSPDYIFGRHSHEQKRKNGEIGIHSVRGGTIVGEHEIIFAGPSEVLKITHTAESKEIFANGAVNAAMFLCGKPAGVYNMSDLLR
ncbi:MAG: 4-hydroxy-tetrahydrodipicolinate reductase [Oscillospiraceae bacterium]|nr:4-hydroxy-tetrahydrodipicolinate reductase [Oscillospiraceae bacterium]